MNNLIWIIIVVVVIKVIIFIKWRKSDWYDKASSSLQNIGVLLAVIFALISYQQSSESLKKTDESLQKTDTSLIYTKEGLEITKLSLKSSDSVSKATLNYLGSISGSSNNVKENIDAISNRISKLPLQIGEIESSLGEINIITKQLKERAEEDANKKPELRFVSVICDSGNGLNILVKNTGDYLVNLSKFKFTIPEGVYINEWELEGFGSATYSDRVMNTQYKYWVDLGTMVRGEEILFKFRFTYIKEQTTLSYFKITAQLNYSALGSLSDILRDSIQVCY